MIHRVELSKLAYRQLQKVPTHVALKLSAWIEAVETEGLETVRQCPGYHDEALRGQRIGQRSIRLSRAYRAIYERRSDGTVDFVEIREVNKHDY